MRGLRGLFGEGFVDKATAYAQGFRDLPNGLSLGTKSLEPLGVDREWFPAHAKSLCSTVRNSSLNPLADQITLELRETRDHVEHESSGWCGQIEAVAEANESNSKRFEFTQGRDQVFQ